MEMPKRKRPLKVFLCHAHADSAAVRVLYTRLTRDGMEVWLDREELLPGQDWELEISRGMHASDVVLVCLSRKFNRRKGYRHTELKMALEKADSLSDDEIFIIPARLEECSVPRALNRWQRVDLFETDGYKKLLRALRGHARSS